MWHILGMINSEPAYHAGQSVRVIVQGDACLAAEIIQCQPVVIRVPEGTTYRYLYYVQIPSACFPGHHNLMWVPERSIGLPEEFGHTLQAGARHALLHSPDPVDPRLYFHAERERERRAARAAAANNPLPFILEALDRH